ncbi:MAG TPA: PEP-CTERM-box response regulator transcription factor, partial [Plasticicumulans sp.]|nr:PEP-CTERM-box response regulator transcription factor [Plasticicumulans sp.]
MNRKLLIVEDDPGLQSQLRWCFADYEVLTADSRDSAIAQLRRHEPPIVTLDLGLPPDPANATEGLATLQEILQLLPSTKVIVVTGNDDRDNALQAVAAGAYDFYQKPVDGDVLKLIVDRAHALYALENENRELAARSQSSKLEGLIAGSASMLKVCRTVEKIAPTDATSLLLGDSGTGKELIARALHDLSNRADKRFVAINCAAIPETLLESELFGHEKGAFTGATQRKPGRFELAHRGTIFLDEIGDLPLTLQAKILRALEEKQFERVGGTSLLHVDVRVVAATNRNLKAAVAARQYREDLYFRLSVFPITIPPLRERPGDIPLLARYFIERFCREMQKPVLSLAPDAIDALLAYPWRGNVRELQNCIERAVILTDGQV